mgnify:CR=1 FL=1
MPRRRPRVRGNRPERTPPPAAVRVGREPVGLPRGLGLQICGCAALGAAGAAIGTLRVLGELVWHLPGERAALTFLVVSGAAGVWLGLWLPRRTLRRWVAQGGAPAAAPRASQRSLPPRVPVELDFAASVVGSLAVATAVLWGLLCLGATFAEEWRAWLAARFLFAPDVKRAWVLGPAALLISAAALAGTLLLGGLHGWQRLVPAGAPAGTLFWAALGAGVIGGGVLGGHAPATPLRDVLAVVLPLAGGVIAVGRRLPGHGTPEPEDERRPFNAALARSLAAPLAAAGALGLLLPQALPTGAMDTGALGRSLVLLGVGTLTGLVVFVGPRAGGLTPWLPLAGAGVVAVCGAWRGPTADALRWAAVGAVLAVVYRRAAQQTLAEVRRSQTALTTLATVGVLGIVLGLVLAPASIRGPDTASAVLLLGAAWLHPLADSAQRPVRYLRRAALGLAVVAVVAAGRVPSGESSGREADGPPEIVGRLASAVGGERAALRLTSRESLWDADLTGPSADVVIADLSAIQELPPGNVRRLIRRWQAALRPGGALVLVGGRTDWHERWVSGEGGAPPMRVRTYRAATGEAVLVAGGTLPARLAAVLGAEARE